MREAIDGTMRPSAQVFIDGLMANPVNAELLRRLPSLGLNECFLTAGCLFQAPGTVCPATPPVEE
jgi:hypothetical protein